MIEAHAVIVNARGLHARPATAVARLAAAYKSDIVICKGKREADAKSIASLLMLVAAQNTELLIRAHGADAKSAVAALLELIAAGFSDDAVINNPQKPEKPAIPKRKKQKTSTTKSAPSLMRKISGIGVAEGIVIGQAHVRQSGEAEVPRYRIPTKEAKAEAARFDAALAEVRADFNVLQAQACGLPGAAEIMPFINLYRSLLDDPEISAKPHESILRRHINAEWALKERVDSIRANFQRVKDAYFRERGRDIDHVMARLLSAMKTRESHTPPPAGGVLIIADLDPASVINLKQSGYEAFVTETGGGMSHTAILARSMNIVAVVGANGALAAAKNGETVIVDADNETVVIDPDPETLHECETRCARKKPARAASRIVGGNGIKSRDGVQVFLDTNIEFPMKWKHRWQRGLTASVFFAPNFYF